MTGLLPASLIPFPKRRHGRPRKNENRGLYLYETGDYGTFRDNEPEVIVSDRSHEQTDEVDQPIHQRTISSCDGACCSEGYQAPSPGYSPEAMEYETPASVSTRQAAAEGSTSAVRNYAIQVQVAQDALGKPPQPVWSSAHQAVFCFPACDAQGCLSPSSFYFPTVRQIDAADGTCTVWWCTCPDPDQAVAQSLFKGATNVGWSKAEALANCHECQHMCP